MLRSQFQSLYYMGLTILAFIAFSLFTILACLVFPISIFALVIFSVAAVFYLTLGCWYATQTYKFYQRAMKVPPTL